MKNNSLAIATRERGAIPLAWAGSTMEMNYLNFGDALSPVMVALMCGLPIERVPTRSASTRMGAVGTIGHGFGEGEVYFWGTGCSNFANPGAPAEERRAFVPDPSWKFHVTSTRGPVSERLLNGPGRQGSGVYGDPVWLMPRFYRPPVKKRWKIGVILHLSELADRSYTANYKPNLVRYDVPEALRDDVHLINTVTPISMASMRDKMDEILACERIVSTSLHGMVIAESYGIPCLYFAPSGAATGPDRIKLDPDGGTDLRIVDLYQGLGQSELDIYVQPRMQRTDWEALMRDIDRIWTPKTLNEDALMEAFPLDLDPVEAPEGATIWEHPAIAGLKLQHDVAELRRSDRVRNRPATAKGAARGPVVSEAPSEAVALSWVATTEEHPHANLGDALSALIVSTITGRPVVRAGFDQDADRLVAVGTIGHAQRNGRLDFWGTGFDATRHPVDHDAPGYGLPPATQMRVHALRGPFSGDLLRRQGLEVPAVYGDPVWMLPRIWSFEDEPKTHDLGVILHISELTDATPEAGPKPAFARYDIPDHLKGRIRLINTYCAPTAEALREKVREIVSCRAILSTSLHGMVISETYGIPNAWFAPHGGGAARLDVHDPDARIDHRMRDFYAGAGADHVLSYAQNRAKETPWEELIDWVGREWTPLNYDDRALIEAFPYPRAVRADDRHWTIPKAAERVPY